MNYFADPEVARRYAASRPYFHPVVFSRLSQIAAMPEPLPLGLDVACGTGQSARALSTVVRHVVAVDASVDMLRHAERDAGDLAAASAERLPFRCATFDVLAVGLAFHWLERGPLLSEAIRVLRDPGWLVIYDNWFPGNMRENPAFHGWYDQAYLSNFPSPARDRRPLSTSEAQAAGFTFVLREQFSNFVTWTCNELVKYLCTQTNVIAAVTRRSLRLEEVEQALSSALKPLFEHQQHGTFEFEGFLWFLQKAV